MRRILRRLARLGAIAVVIALGLPVALLIPAALLDRGPDGGSRASLFPLALSAWDPFVWACVRNSVIVATIVSAGSLLAGVVLARAVAAWRFWGRPPLASIAWLPLAAPPFLAALGLKHSLPPGEVGGRLAAMTGRALFLEVPWDVWIAWGLLVWSGLAWGIPLVALSVKAAMSRIDPDWAEAGRALGASRYRAWRQLVWPMIRPETARTLAAVFAATMLEPGAPLILGLRRTLPYSLVETTLRGIDPTRTAALALIGLSIALLGRLLIRFWGGPRVELDPRGGDERTPRAPWWRAALAVVGLTAWAAFGLAPITGLVGIALGGTGGTGGRDWLLPVSTVAYAILDPDLARLWRNSLFLALVATAAAAGLVAILARAERPGRRRVWGPSLPILVLERTPPLILGVALALLPGMLELAANRLGIPALRRLAAAIDPVRWPGLLLVAATVSARVPTLARAADRADLRARPALADAALVLGASRRRSTRLAGGRGPGRGVLLLNFTLAATSAASALVLAPTIRTRPVGPGIIILADDPPRAAALALGAVSLNSLGLVAARRSRSGPAGDWLRG
jgi:ABC-type Fe3+ transport system permease subunit